MKILLSSRKYAERPEDRLLSALGISRWGNSGPKLSTYSDYRGKWNYVISDRYYDLSKEEADKFIQKIRAAGGKYATYRRGAVYFYIDTSKFQDAYKAEQAELDNQYSDTLNAINIDQYKPTEAIIEKLRDYRDKGSRVNVKAIKDTDKLLTYYYGANLIGWGELMAACSQALGYNYDDLVEAIRRRVAVNDEYKDSRNELSQKLDLPNTDLFTMEDKNCWLPKSILKFFIDNNVPVHFGKRTGGSQFDRNGRQWSEIEHLTLYPDSDNPIEYDIVVHTDEGGGATTYTGFGSNGRTDERISAKKIIESLSNIIK